MRFRLFGIPIEIQAGFWLMAAALGFPLLRAEHKASILVWVGVVFVSVMVHELGHALAIIRYRSEPAITLYYFGGLTSWQRPQQVGRLQRIAVSVAGPGAGFVLAGLVYATIKLAPSLSRELPYYAAFGLEQLFQVNLGWGLFNLIPVLPFDGGHILMEALGPKRLRTTAIVSLVCGVGIALFFAIGGHLWVTFLVGMGAIQSYQQLQAAAVPDGGARIRRGAKPREGDDAPPPELANTLASARRALADERFAEAAALCEEVLGSKPPRGAEREALHLLGWVHVLEGRGDEAAKVLGAIERKGEIDKALAAAVLRANGRNDVARTVLEAARAEGDDRKEIVGPLIQILIEQGEVTRAAAIALDIVDSLSEQDARRMAEIACDAKSYQWAARLSEAVFERSGAPDDAYDAARARALEGDKPGAMALLRRAVAAGFSDRARAWSDVALEPLRAGGELDALLPRPSPQ
jgi:Zn-dependent protease